MLPTWSLSIASCWSPRRKPRLEELPTDQAVEADAGETEEESPLPPGSNCRADPGRSAAAGMEAIIATAREEADSILAELEEERKQTAEELARVKAETAAECDRPPKERPKTTDTKQVGLLDKLKVKKHGRKRSRRNETTLQEAKTEALNLINQAEEERMARIQIPKRKSSPHANIVGIARKNNFIAP